MYQHGFAFNSRHGSNLRSALCQLIFKKVLKLSGSSIASTDLGHILNIIANDLNRFENLGFFITYLAIGPLSIIVSFAITYVYLKNAAYAGFVMLILFVPFQSFMGTLYSKFRAETTVVTDKRVNLMSEILQAIKLIKVYCWESPFSGKVNNIRQEEIRVYRKSYYLDGVNCTFFFAAEKVILFACFMAYNFIYGRLDTETVFVVMCVYDAVRVPVLGMYPEAIGLLGESLVAMGRINALLMKEDTGNQKSALQGADRFALMNGAKNNYIQEPRECVVLNNYCGKWTKEVVINNLSDISFNVITGEIVLVVGPVGCGKTCLLYALLNEIESVSGSCTVNGKVSYAAQESWCFGGTVRQNILLGNEYEKMRYQKVVEVCGLERDLKLFEKGDSTRVGDKGDNLSGGQKARVSLARAVYHEADVYLLDDPLSAVDPKIANHIFEKCIQGFLRGKTIILVTHQLQFLSLADKVVVLNQGRLTAVGSYKRLKDENIEFLKFLDVKKKEEEQRKESMSRQKSLSVNHQTPSKDTVDQVAEVKEKREDEEDNEEHKLTGAVSVHVFWSYFRAGGSVTFIALIFIGSIISQGTYFLTDIWLAAWTQHSTHNQSAGNPIAASLIFQDESNNLIFYACLIILVFLLGFLRMISVYYLCLQSSVNLHDRVFRRVARSPMSFFESNPLGRILNRFTRDMAIIDSLIPRSVMDLNLTIFDVLGIVIISITINPWFIIPSVMLGGLSVPVREYYVRTSRDLHRLDSMARSPLYHYLSSTFNGIISIRSFGIQELMEKQYIRYLNDSVSTRFHVFYAIRHFGVILDMFSLMYITCICVVLVETPQGTIAGGDAALVLSQSMLLIGLFQFTVRMTSELENQMTSVERVLEYGELPSEAELRIQGKVEDKKWPHKGGIIFKSVSLRYSPHAAPVLNQLTFNVAPGEKIGIVGRTGAGKSSLISVLFRLVEPEGQVIIDGLDIKSLGLHELRQKISIIPQDPSLFSGTVRDNLDPFNENDDSSIWQALEEAHMTPTIRGMGGLDSKVTEGGTNLSVGQRQLLCLGRALLKNNKILVMDEATANVDQETDELIQKTIKTTFKDKTVLTVAHRLNTIIDMDKVLVMDAGRIIEFDEPFVLLKDVASLFHSMVKQTGPEFENMLHDLAEKSHFNKL
jgi:ATP-binding cassette subfamily C (CFTR/MRP) protein 4